MQNRRQSTCPIVTSVKGRADGARSISRVELEVAVPIDRPDFELLLPALPDHAQFDCDAGVAEPPQRAIEIREVMGRGALDRRHPVAVLDAGGFARAARRDAADDELPIQFLKIDAEP